MSSLMIVLRFVFTSPLSGLSSNAWPAMFEADQGRKNYKKLSSLEIKKNFTTTNIYHHISSVIILRIILYK